MKRINFKTKSFVILITFAFMVHPSFAQTLPEIYEKFEGAQVYTKGDSLIVNTGEVERVWVWTGNGLVTKYLKNVLTGRKYLNSQKNVQSDWMLWDPQIEKDKKKGASSLSGCDWNWLKPDDIPLHAKLESVTAKVNDDEGFTNKYIEVVSRIRYESLNLEVQHVIWVYPNSPGTRTQLRIKAIPGFQPENFPKNDTVTKYYGGTLPVPGGRAEFLPLDFSVKNQRDYWGYYNDPGNRHDQSMDMLKEELVQGYPLFQIESNNWASGFGVDYGKHGVCVIKESPKTVNQQGHNTGSFYSGSGGLWITGLGLLPGEVSTDRFRECWANWTILYSGNNDNMQLAVKRFDRVRYPAFAKRDLFILGNTWGPANPLGNQFTEESFVLNEIPALAKIGVDVLQIDDGWQKSQAGSSARDFLPKYTNGWKDIKAEGDKFGVKFGLWVSIQNAKVSDLMKDIDELGFLSWKVDFDHLANRKDFEDRTKSYREVMKHAWMKTQFTLCPEYDNLRYGWYYAKEYGSIYFQNIQEALPEHLTMVPYHVLRQHWLMSKYFNSNKLQVLLQNPKRTNHERSDAYLHGHSYCFAMGLPFIPAFFQSAQFLDDEGQKELKQLISIYKKYREEMFKCYAFPVGDVPSNDSWSGFQMVNEQADKGYLLLFRELHNKEIEKEISLKFLTNKKIRITNLEDGKVSQQKVNVNGGVVFSLPNPASYLFLQYELLK
jgi:hypothetical protein